MLHSALDVRTEARKIPVRPRQGEREKYELKFQTPSCASYTSSTKGFAFNLETSVTKAEIEFNGRSKQIEALCRANIWQVNLLNRTADTSVDAISVTVDSVLEAISYGGPSIVNLSFLKPEFVNAEHLVAILRTTFSWRDQVPGWKNALQAAPVILKMYGLDPEDELFGLDATQ